MVKIQRLFAKTNLKIRVCEAMKAPVGLLSDRTVLRSKMEGPRPDKFQFVVHVPGRVWGGTAFAKRSEAMKAPVGLLSGSAVCDSRWRGVAPTSASQQEHFGNSQELEK